MMVRGDEFFVTCPLLSVTPALFLSNISLYDLEKISDCAPFHSFLCLEIIVIFIDTMPLMHCCTKMHSCFFSLPCIFEKVSKVQ